MIRITEAEIMKMYPKMFAAQHIKEFPNYYKYLPKFEKKLEKMREKK